MVSEDDDELIVPQEHYAALLSTIVAAQVRTRFPAVVATQGDDDVDATTDGRTHATSSIPAGSRLSPFDVAVPHAYCGRGRS